MRVLICDNDINDVLSINESVSEFFKNNVEITVINESEKFINLSQTKFDIIIMDIMLDNGISGIDLIRKSMNKYSEIPIIFVSSNPEFFMDVYCVNHIYFITKPIDKNILFRALKKAVNIYSKQYISFYSNGTLKRMEHNDVMYIEAHKHNSLIHLKNGLTDESSSSISQISEQLCNRGFIRCHKSFCVNINHISQYKKTSLLLESGVQIPIGRLYMSDTKDKILQFWGNDI